MSFAISALFLLDTYQGHDRYGNVERYPSPLRLFSALVSAAYTDARVQTSDSVVDLPSASTDALHWFELNPPDAVELPPSVLNTGGWAKAFRRKGWSQSSRVDGPDRPDAAEPAIGRSCLSGALRWWWEQNPPEEVARQLSLLCGDIPYLGEAGSPVVVSTQISDNVPGGVFLRDDGAVFGASGMIAFDVPTEGRAQALQTSYLKRSQNRVPSAAADRALGKDGSPHKSERDISDTWEEAGILEQVAYLAPLQGEAERALPWGVGFLVRVSPLDGTFPWRPTPDTRCDWAVGLHQAIVSSIGTEASSVITGRTLSGMPRPANNMAVQILDSGMPVSSDLPITENAVFLVLLPIGMNGASPADIDLVQRALERIPQIRASRPILSPTGVQTGKHLLGRVRVESIEEISPATVWSDVPSGYQRWWTPHPLAIADTRTPNRGAKSKGEAWTTDDTLRVAVGNVFRDQLHLSASRGDRRLRELSEKVAFAGVKIGASHQALPQHPERYVHHVKAHTPIIPVQGFVNFGGLLPEQAIVAIGQSRHFGVGLLVPVDLPELEKVSSLHDLTDQKEYTA